MPNGEVTTNELLEFLQENMATKDDLKVLITRDDAKAFATKDDMFGMKMELETSINNLAQELRATENRLIDHIDGLTKRHEMHDHEITALRSRCGRIERHVGMN